ncbi:MAG TPA: hypothetical protein VNT54_15865 [Solirubrobacteraceae bacterium]|nr:hypothetical protein [Solirubrobacteraceae bacterium]
MEHRDDAPLADEPQPGAVPNDQPAGAAGDQAAARTRPDDEEDGEPE